VLEKDFSFGGCLNPAYLVCAPKPGPAVFVNIVPGPKDSFDLVVAPVKILPDSPRKDMRGAIRGWIRPACGIAEFLERYSRHGGTHHNALVLGQPVEALTAFAAFVGIPCHLL